jgi:hypothetical protein
MLAPLSCPSQAKISRSRIGHIVGFPAREGEVDPMRPSTTLKLHLLTLLLLGLLLAGCRKEKEGAGANGAAPGLRAPRRVFLITVDTLRADHMSLYGYPRATSPNLEKLAASGVTFDRAICQWPKTGS